MEDFSKVSLGFAEFVSQLLHETFDAVLSAQNYQLEKYSELEKALSISTSTFKELYISDDEIKTKEIEIYGASIIEGMTVSGDLLSAIKQQVENYDQQKMIVQGALTKEGAAILEQLAVEAIASGKKADIRLLINKSEMVRLMVDSGEIHAKLELSNLYQSTDSGTPSADTAKKTVAKSAVKEATSDALPIKPASLNSISLNSSSIKEVKIQEISDPVTKQKILVIDKTTLQKDLASSGAMPRVRLIATPIQASSNSSLFSEVIIKFKTI
jgi:hypothetical protein